MEERVAAIESTLSTLEPLIKSMQSTINGIAEKFEGLTVNSESPIHPKSSASNIEPREEAVPLKGNAGPPKESTENETAESSLKVIEQNSSSVPTKATFQSDQIRLKTDDFPTYDGSIELGKDINYWIRRVEAMTEAVGTNGFAVNEYRKIIVRNFRGTATDKLSSAFEDFGKLKEWGDVKRFLRELFGDPGYRDRLYFELNTRLLHPFEELSEYWDYYRYCIESAIRIGASNESQDRAFREGRINWVLDHLPPTFATELRQRWSENRDRSSLSNFGRTLFLDSVKNARKADLERELYIFVKSEYFKQRKEKLLPKVRKMVADNNWTVYGLLSSPSVTGPSPTRRSPPTINNRPVQKKQLVMFAESGPRANGYRKFRCVCGGSHRYCDCPTPEGKSKCEEIKNRLKSQRPGIHVLADDNESYWLEESVASVPICLIDDEGDDEVGSSAEVDQEPEDFLNAGY